MTHEALLLILNSLTRYDLEYEGNSYMQDRTMVENKYDGEWVKVEDLAALFEVEFGHRYIGDSSVYDFHKKED